MPAQDKPRDNLRWSEREVGTKAGAWEPIPSWVEHKHPTDREGLCAWRMPEGDLRQHPHALVDTPIPGDSNCLALVLGLLHPRLQGGPTRPLLGLRSPLARRHWLRRGVEPGIEAQPGTQSPLVGPAGPRQPYTGLGAVTHKPPGFLHPARDDLHHLDCPIACGLVACPRPLVGTLRGRQPCQK